MFHQANMHAFDYQGEKWSLVNLWSYIALKEIMTFINKLPVLTPPMVSTCCLWVAGCLLAQPSF